jgi:hypothetical protein
MMKYIIYSSSIVCGLLLSAFMPGALFARASTITVPSAQDIFEIIGPVVSQADLTSFLSQVASGTPISQIGTPISHEIKCVILANIGSPIPGFASECSALTPPPPSGSSGGGTLTGTVVGGAASTSGGLTGTVGASSGTLTGTVAASGNTLTGAVVPSGNTLTGTVVSGGGGGGGGGSGSGGGGGSGGGNGSPAILGASSGGGGSPGASPGEVLGTSTQTPNIPNTGTGGDAFANYLALALSASVVSGGLWFMRQTEKKTQ